MTGNGKRERGGGRTYSTVGHRLDSNCLSKDTASVYQAHAWPTELVGPAISIGWLFHGFTGEDIWGNGMREQGMTCSKGPVVGIEPGQLQRGQGLYTFGFFNYFWPFYGFNCEDSSPIKVGSLRRLDSDLACCSEDTASRDTRFTKPRNDNFHGKLNEQRRPGLNSKLWQGSVHLGPGMNQPLVSIHHVFSPVLLSPLSLNQDHPGPGEDTMESPISLDAAALMYLCKRVRWNQRGLLEVFEMHKDGN